MGFGLAYLPANVVVATYFRNKRALATGIASCGSGIGALVMAPIISFLEDSFGWGHSMMLIGTLVLACIPLGMLFRPIINDTKETSKYEKCTKISGGVDEFDKTNKGVPVPNNCALPMPKLLIPCLLSSILFNVGFAVPYVYTVVSIK